MTDDELLAALDNCTLEPQHFKHLGHLRLAWLHLQRYGIDEAVVRTCDTIRTYATQLGAPDKFHWTVTEALMYLLLDAGASRSRLSLEDFLAANGSLIDDARARLADHYSAAVLDSPEARAHFVAPDIAPLPRRVVPGSRFGV